MVGTARRRRSPSDRATGPLVRSIDSSGTARPASLTTSPFLTPLFTPHRSPPLALQPSAPVGCPRPFCRPSTSSVGTLVTISSTPSQTASTRHQRSPLRCNPPSSLRCHPALNPPHPSRLLPTARSPASHAVSTEPVGRDEFVLVKHFRIHSRTCRSTHVHCTHWFTHASKPTPSTDLSARLSRDCPPPQSAGRSPADCTDSTQLSRRSRRRPCDASASRGHRSPPGRSRRRPSSRARGRAPGCRCCFRTRRTGCCRRGR